MNTPNSLQKHSSFVASVIKDLLLTLITCGIYNIFVQYRQILALNDMLKRPKYSFIQWALFTLITCGLYHMYHEYLMTRDIVQCNNDPHSSEPVLALILSALGFWIIADAIQQAGINRFYGYDGL